MRIDTVPDKTEFEELAKGRDEKRCPYLSSDEFGPYCRNSLNDGEAIGIERRVACDKHSICICLGMNEKDYHKCYLYSDTSFFAKSKTAQGNS